MKKINKLIVFAGIMLIFISISAKKNEEASLNFKENLSNIDQITISGEFNLHISQSKTPSLRIEGKKDELRNIKVKVVDNQLIITPEKGKKIFNQDPEADIFLTLNTIEVVKLDGNIDLTSSETLKGATLFISAGGRSNIDLNDLQYEKIKIIGESASQIVVRGNCDQLWIKLDGAGLIDAQNLKASDAFVTCDGIGNIIVNSDHILQATLDGIGSIQYLGNPQIIKKDIEGLGTISPYN